MICQVDIKKLLNAKVVVCSFYCLCVLCKSCHFLCVLHKSCHFLFKSIAKASNLLFPVYRFPSTLPFSVYYLVCQESRHLPCLELTLYCLLFPPKSTLFSQGFAVAFYLGDCFLSAVRSLISVLCWVNCLSPPCFVKWRGEEVPPCVSGEEMNTCAGFSHYVLLKL